MKDEFPGTVPTSEKSDWWIEESELSNKLDKKYWGMKFPNNNRTWIDKLFGLNKEITIYTPTAIGKGLYIMLELNIDILSKSEELKNENNT